MAIAKTLALSIAIFSSVVVANTVTLYDNTAFQGESVKLQVEPNVCKNVDVAFSQRAESADWDLPRGVGGFLSFFEGPDCSGSSSWWSVDTTSYPDDFSKDALANKIGSVKFALPLDAITDATEWADDDGVRGVVDGNATVVPAPRQLRSTSE